MKRLAVLTTTAAATLLGVAHAQPASNDPTRAALDAYAAYQMDITALRTHRLNNAEALETAIDQATRHNRDAFSRGWIAYGGSIAAQSPTFVAGVREAAQTYGRDNVIWALTADTSYARTLKGGGEAVRLVLASANADGARIIQVADRYQEQAYSLQRQRWANAVAPGQSARVQRIRSLGQTGSGAVSLADVSSRLTVTPASFSPASDPTAFGGRRFWDSIRGGGQVTEVASSAPSRFRIDPPRGEAVNRMMTIGALQALDAVSERASAVETLMTEQRSRDCLQMAQLQLYQCMSAARFRYENAFCLSQHAMRDVGSCVSAVARPDTTAMTPVPARGG